jgi:hypothetical protein
MNPKKYLRDLPKYKKTWAKEKSTFGFMDEAHSVYLIFESLEIDNYDKVVIKRIPQKQLNYPSDNLYFFELFKYLKKYKAYAGSFSVKKPNKNDIKKFIKMHLLQKHSKELIKDKLIYLNDYSNLINYCFDALDQNAYVKISLVIEKKLGYKYYENIVYT